MGLRVRSAVGAASRVLILSLKLCDRSTSPQWSESFHFLVRDPKHQMLIVKVRRSSAFTRPSDLDFVA